MFEVAKRNKRVHIIKSDGESVYVAPFFIQATSRDDYKKLCDIFNTVGYRCINAISEFETKFGKR